MDNVLYAIGGGGRYLYNAPKRRVCNSLPKEFEDERKAGRVKSIIHASFGSSAEEYYICYHPKENEVAICYGDDLAPELLKWLKAEVFDTYEHRLHARVELGPNKSFIAWTRTSIRWNCIPKAMEESLQGWLSPAGWTVGPPRLAALGHSQAFFILSEYGASSYSLPGSYPSTIAEFNAYKAVTGFEWSNVEKLFFNAAQDDEFVVVFKNTWTRTSRDVSKEYMAVADSYASPDMLASYKKEREDAQKENERLKREEEAAERKAEQERVKEEMVRLQYAIWMSTYENAFAQTKLLTVFPYLPAEICVCAVEQCKIRKKETALLACRHDVECLLRASGSYNKNWLKIQRQQWHPDRFSRKCQPDHRQRLSKISTELYCIYEELIAELED